MANPSAHRAPVPAKWDATQMPPQKGKKAIVTGANSGIGFFTALELARHGADVVLACRSEEKGLEAVDKIEQELKLTPNAGKVEFRQLDLSSLASVKRFADAFTATHDCLDLLINNAGMTKTTYTLSVDGIESQFATNHLGHFALTAWLFDLIKQSEHARIVNVSSDYYVKADMDLNAIVARAETYEPRTVYCTTKLYNLLFTSELNRRLRTRGIKGVIAIGVSPGFVSTNFKDALLEEANWFKRQIIKLVWNTLPFSQDPDAGALTSLYAATAPGVQPDDFYLPDGMAARKGFPMLHETTDLVKSKSHALALWEESERLAKLSFSV